MAKTSTLGSPGIEVIEEDASIRVSTSTSTTAFLCGYAAQGPVEEVIPISGTTEFKTIFGNPTNRAEQFFYDAVKVFKENSGPSTTIYTSRLPYGSGDGDNISSSYTLHAFPAIPVLKKDNVGYDRYTCDSLNNFFSIVNKAVEVSSVTVPTSLKESETVEYELDEESSFLNYTYDKKTDVLTIPYHHKFYEIDTEEQTDTEAEKAKSELGSAYSMIVEKSDGSELFVYTLNGTAHARLVKRHITSFHEMCYLNNVWREFTGGSVLNESFVVDHSANPHYGYVSYGLKEGSDSTYIYNNVSYNC